MRELSQVELNEKRAEARERQKKRRAKARESGKCCICAVNPVTEGLNQQLEPYTTCERCRTRTGAAVERAREREKKRKRVYVYDPALGRCVQKTIGKVEPKPLPDRFCVECQAHGFHRADCPTLKSKKPRPKPVALASWLDAAAAAALASTDRAVEWDAGWSRAS